MVCIDMSEEVTVPKASVRKFSNMQRLYFYILLKYAGDDDDWVFDARRRQKVVWCWMFDPVCAYPPFNIPRTIARNPQMPFAMQPFPQTSLTNRLLDV